MTTSYLDINYSVNSGWMRSDRSIMTFCKNKQEDDFKKINTWYNNIQCWGSMNI